MKRSLGSVALIAATAIALAGCAAAPATPTASSSYKACMVTNSGGLNDRSFNQSSWAGIEEAKKQLGIKTNVAVSTGETDLAPNVENQVAAGCDFILTVGWELAEATAAQSKANPDIHFSIVDEVVEGDNVKSIVFDTAQASYLAGYLAAGVSKTGKVATFGGDNQPPVTLFMDGFVDGVAKYNEVHGTAVQVLGWDKATQNGTFTGDYEDIAKGKTYTQGFIDQGADVILPVAGQVGEGSAAAAIENPGVLVIWVDNDGYDTLPAEYRPVLLTSVMKNTGPAVTEIITKDVEGTFDPSPYVGTLANDGVAIAPFHDLTDRVGQTLADEVNTLKGDIVSGAIVVTSPSSPK